MWRPSQQQAQHVAQVVASIGYQGQGANHYPDGQLDDHKAEVQSDADGEGAIKAGGQVVVMVRVMFAVVVLLGHAGAPGKARDWR